MSEQKVIYLKVASYYSPVPNFFQSIFCKAISMQAKDAILLTINQVTDLLNQIEPHEYSRPLPEFDGSSLGQHFRHILEFFICLERGVPTGVVDYASRERNLLFEDAPKVALAAIVSFAETMKTLEPATQVALKAEFGGNERPSYLSTVGRELAFVYDHAIHHLAIIKIGLRCHFPHIQIDRNLGVSPSTIKARKLAG